jgi:hypothetical protein
MDPDSNHTNRAMARSPQPSEGWHRPPTEGAISDVYDFGTTVMKFTAAQGAEGHCADGPADPQTRNQVVFDWLDRLL